MMFNTHNSKLTLAVVIAILSCSSTHARRLLQQPQTTAAQSSNSNQDVLLIFGDSLSDTGNLYAITERKNPPDQYYYHGRFSNGPVWADHLHETYNGIKIINYAVSGATSCPGSFPLATGAGTLSDEVDRFASLKVPPKDDGTPQSATHAALLPSLIAKTAPAGAGDKVSAAAVVLAGSNDFLRSFLQAAQAVTDALDNLEELPPKVVDCTVAQIKRIIDLLSSPPGSANKPAVKTLMISGLPPVELSPLVSATAPTQLVKSIKNAIEHHNALLQVAVQKLARETRKSGRNAPNVVYFDLYHPTLTLYTAANAYGIEQPQQCCVQYGFVFPVLKTLLAKTVLNNQIMGTGSSLATPSTVALVSGSNANNNGNAPLVSKASGPSGDDTPRVQSIVKRNGTTGNAGGVVVNQTDSSTGKSSVVASTSQKASEQLQAGSVASNAAGNTPAPRVEASSGQPDNGNAGGMGGNILGGLNLFSNAPGAAPMDMMFSTISGACTDGNAHFFYDAVHPTTKVHGLAAAAMRVALEAATKGQFP